MDTTSLIEARKKAEKAVAEMPEGELRVEAFKIILNRLLADGSNAAPRQKAARSKSRKNREPGGDRNEEIVPRSVPDRILALKLEGYFGEQRGIAEIREELQTHGWRYSLTALSGPLMRLVRRRELRRSRVGDAGKTTYKYFNP